MTQSTQKQTPSIVSCGPKYPNIYCVVDSALNDNLRHRECHGPFKAHVRRWLKDQSAKVYLRRSTKSGRYYFKVEWPLVA